MSASSEDAARCLAAELGAEAEACETPHGWIVSLPAPGASRVAALVRLAAASRSVVAEHADAQLFVLDGARPIRIPPVS